MRRSCAVALALLIAACGDISNDPLEDLLFLEALPTAAEVALQGPESGSARQALTRGTRRDAASACSPEAPDWVFCLGHELAYVVNLFTYQTLWIVDRVRELPPTERGPDFRAWGPHRDDSHPGRRWRLEVSRTREGESLRYAWQVLLYPAGEEEPVVVTDGRFDPAPGGSARGVGAFTWHGRRARDRGLAAAADPDELAMTYDLTARPRRIGCRLTGADGATIDFDNDLADDGAGGWPYALGLALEEDGLRDDLLEVRARWDAARAGRADAHLTVDSPRIPPGPWAIRACWGAAPDFALAYYDNEVQPEICGAGGCPVGDAFACRFEPLL